MSYNINGTGQRKVAANREEWQQLFAATDMVLLQETRSIKTDPMRGMLSATHACVVVCPPGNNGTAGYGLAVYHKRSMQVVPVLLDQYVMWVKVCSRGSQLMVANVYVPLNASKGLEVLDAVALRAQQYRQAGYAVVVAGDLNAHVAGGEDRPLDAHGTPVPGICSRAVRVGERVNRYGTAVLDMCHTAGLVLLTGRGAQCESPQAVLDSYVRENGRSRPDHVLVSLDMTGWIVSHTVQPGMHGLSDHLPLVVALRVPACATAAASDAQPQAQGPLPRRLLWEASRREEYVDYVADNVVLHAQLDAMPQLLESGDLQAAVGALHGAVLHAGEGAGMRVVSGQRGPCRTQFHQPWFDAECRVAKARVKALPRVVTADHKRMRALFQRKRRAWRLHVNSELDAECVERGQKCLWRDMRKGVCRGVPNVCPAGDHLNHLSAKFAGAGVGEESSQPVALTEEEVASVVNEETVHLALSKLNKRAAVGIPGVPVQALAAPRMLQAVVLLLQAVYRAGYEPCSMKEGLLVPVHKRGDATLPTSYRPIVVSCVLHKIYAWCICHASRKWMRATPGDLLPRHCGFLPQRSTLHNVFMLSNAIHHAVGRGERLCVLLLDVASAFDNVDHACMLATLSEMGMPQHLVRAIRGMYSGLQYKLSGVGGRLTEPLNVGVGVKQGCPVSPLLFCLYVQPVSGDLAGGVTPGMYSLAGESLPDWAYADDFVLLTYTVEGLQQLTGEAARAFLQRHLKLEPAKCVVFSVNVPDGVSVSLEGRQVPPASPEGERYLGVMFDSMARFSTMAQHRAKCMQSAFRVGRGKVQASDDIISCMPVILRVLNQGIVPVGSYACEVWGLGSLPRVGRGNFELSQFYSLSDPVELVRCGILRSWLRLPQSTAKMCLLHELGLQPLSHEYTRRAVRFWNTLVAMPHDSPYRKALRQNVEDAFDTRGFKGVNFARALYSVLKLLGVEQRLESTMRDMCVIPARQVEQKLLSKYTDWVASLVVAAGPGRGVIGQYFSGMSTHAVGTRPVWYCINVPHKVAVRFLRFRIGCHHLRVNTGRWQVPVLVKRHRKCIRCAGVFERAMDVPLDDENHSLIHCQEPVLAKHRGYLEYQIRRWMPHAALNSMREVFAAVEETGKKCVQRNFMGYVAKCYRVAQCCHEDIVQWQSGLQVQEAVSAANFAAWMAREEAKYAAGMVPGLPSDSSIEEASEASELSEMFGFEPYVVDNVVVSDVEESLGDSMEWEDVV